MFQEKMLAYNKSQNPLSELIGCPQNHHVGYTLHMDYGSAIVAVADAHRHKAGGLHLNSFLLAAEYDKETGEPNLNGQIVLLRVSGRKSMPLDAVQQKTILEIVQASDSTAEASMDPYAIATLQFAGVECRILGSYWDDGQELEFGADVEDFFAARPMKVWKPGGPALARIVNFVQPMRRKIADEEARKAGLDTAPAPIRVGMVRFTSARSRAAAEAHVDIFPGDFISRRSAMFGMTRTGKSNAVKTVVSAVAIAARQGGLPIGQLIFDINGEYANANDQDKGSSIATAFGDACVRYSCVDRSGFRDMRVNFYESPGLAMMQIREAIEDKGLGEDLSTFLNVDLNPLPKDADMGQKNHYGRQLAIFKAILREAKFPVPSDHQVTLNLKKEVLQKALGLDSKVSDSEFHASLQNAYDMIALRKAGWYRLPIDGCVSLMKALRDLDHSGGIKGKDARSSYFDPTERAMLAILTGISSKTGAGIRSINTIKNAALGYHSPVGAEDVDKDIHEELRAGKIVIVDLSVGAPAIREVIARRLAKRLFDAATKDFTRNETPSRIMIYIEEAHNLIGKKAELTSVWPRLAKEGAKFGIGLVYSTQEPSSVHANILANTENFFVTHLNNAAEIKALADFYDFRDFSESLLRCQDVGFARVKTLSASFTVPTQIAKFDAHEAALKFAHVEQGRR